MTTKPMTVGDMVNALLAFDQDLRLVVTDKNDPSVSYDVTFPDEEEAIGELEDGNLVVILDCDFDSPLR